VKNCQEKGAFLASFFGKTREKFAKISFTVKNRTKKGRPNGASLK
jgi:hypothetical protein